MSEGRPKWLIQPVRKEHERTSFDCGVDELDEFIQKYARQSERLGLARTFVAVTATSLRVLGYFTLRTGSVDFADLPPEDTKRLPKYPVPVVHLARLAVDRAAQGHGLGEALLWDALSKARDATNVIAAFAVEVIAINNDARDFYLKYGFKSLLRDEKHLYLPMKTLAKVFVR